MSDDLVKELRDFAKSHRVTFDDSDLVYIAASHIEALESALREIVEQIKRYDLPAPVVTLLVMQKAEAALAGEKKDD